MSRNEAGVGTFFKNDVTCMQHQPSDEIGVLIGLLNFFFGKRSVSISASKFGNVAVKILRLKRESKISQKLF